MHTMSRKTLAAGLTLAVVALSAATLPAQERPRLGGVVQPKDPAGSTKQTGTKKTGTTLRPVTTPTNGYRPYIPPTPYQSNYNAFQQPLNTMPVNFGPQTSFYPGPNQPYNPTAFNPYTMNPNNPGSFNPYGPYPNNPSLFAPNYQNPFGPYQTVNNPYNQALLGPSSQQFNPGYNFYAGLRNQNFSPYGTGPFTNPYGMTVSPNGNPYGMVFSPNSNPYGMVNNPYGAQYGNPFANTFMANPVANQPYFNQFPNQFGNQFPNQFGNQFPNQFGNQFPNQFGNQFPNQFGNQFRNQFSNQFAGF